MKSKKDYKALLYIIIIIIILGGCVSVGTYLYVKDKNEKVEQKQEEVNKRNAEIAEIRKQNDLAFKDYQPDLEYLGSLSYEEIKDSIVSQDSLKDKTEIKIYVDGEEIKDDAIISLDEVKTYEIKIELLYDYFYEENGETKSEQIKNSKTFTINVLDTIKPVLNGVKDKTITVGDKLDILSGITATDEKEGTLEVKYEGEVNTSKAGTYKVKIYAEDKNGNRVEQDMTITVKAKATTTKPSTGTTTKPSTGGTTTPSTGSSTKPSTTPTCDVSNAVLQKRGYKPTQDKDACSKNKQATEIAQKVANEILAKGYKTDLEKVDAAAKIVSAYYQKGRHVELEGFDYRTPYGVFIKGEASCAGCTRALIQVLELMGFKNLKHANENMKDHQWVILEMDGQKGFAEAQLGFAGYGCHEVDDSPECMNPESN